MDKSIGKRVFLLAQDTAHHAAHGYLDMIRYPNRHIISI